MATGAATPSPEATSSAENCDGQMTTAARRAVITASDGSPALVGEPERHDVVHGQHLGARGRWQAQVHPVDDPLAAVEDPPGRRAGAPATHR